MKTVIYECRAEIDGRDDFDQVGVTGYSSMEDAIREYAQTWYDNDGAEAFQDSHSLIFECRELGTELIKTFAVGVEYSPYFVIDEVKDKKP